ncbi:T9SS type A sorting domain-containing protein [Aureisphaera galaxeae]|uniref:T9SS type A sorting domain-containing protein n=1 Tax=Aureisphaera galaxeae TaxID=1538023 RepID=UPI0023506A51|nr:T9SS type A sorting domain-containing protein [Aureisphaera galaxeae]MDC8006019.1 T9SS type A sorting domain-containing protein [Aureisphaera galaxeae]
MTSKLILLISFVSISWLKAQTVSTVTEGTITDGLGIDSQGNIYGSDFGGDTVYKYNPTTGEVSVFQTGFSNPNGIGVNSDDEVFVCDHTGNTIYMYDTSGNLLDTFTGFTTPTGIKETPDMDGYMLVVEYQANRIKLLDADIGDVEVLVSGSPLNGPAGIAYIGNTPYIGNFNDRKIFRLDNYDTLVEIAQLPATAAGSNFLGFLTAKGGFLFATQLGEHKIYRIDPVSGEVVLFAGSVAGGDDGPLEDATFNLPNGILADEANDRLYISDAQPKNLRIIDGVTLGANDNRIIINELKLFPNPPQDALMLQGKLPAGAYQVFVYDTLGSRLLSQKMDVLQGQIYSEIDVSRLPSGTYVLELSKGNIAISKKFVK